MDKRRGRISNVKRNIFFGILYVAVSQFFPFIVRTILIYSFGVEYLGLNSLFASVLSVLSLMELGFGTAVVYSMYQPVAEKNTDQICAHLAYYRRIYRLIGIVVMAVGLALLPFLKWLIYDPVLPGELNIYYCYLIFLGDAAVSYLLYGYMTAIPTAYQRRDILSRVDIGMVCLKCVAQSLVLVYFNCFYLFLLTIPMITIARNLVINYVVKKKYPEIACKGEISAVQKKDLNRRVKGLIVSKLTNVSRNSIDCVLGVTGKYNNYYFVLRAFGAFSTTVCSSMFASVGNSIAIETKEKNYQDLQLFDFVYMAIVGWATVSMLCLYQPFIRLWIGEEMMLDTSVAILLSLYFYFLKSGDIRWVYHEGAGLWYECRHIMVCEALANIVLNIFFCRYLGVIGIVLATLLSVFVTNLVLCPRLLFKLYFKSITMLYQYWRDHSLYTITMLVSAIICYGLCEHFFSVNGFIFLIGRLIICSVVCALVFLLFWSHNERFCKAVSLMRKMKNA